MRALECASVAYKSLKEILSAVVPLTSSCAPAMHHEWLPNIIKRFIVFKLPEG